MAGQLTIDTLKASSGVLATQNGMTGICKAWVNFTANTTTPTIGNSFNVSSLTYNAAGQYYVNFTTSMPSSSYSVVASCSDTLPFGSRADQQRMCMAAASATNRCAVTGIAGGASGAVGNYLSYIGVSVFA